MSVFRNFTHLSFRLTSSRVILKRLNTESNRILIKYTREWEIWKNMSQYVIWRLTWKESEGRWLGNEKRNDRRKSRMEGSPFDRSKVTSKPRSPGFTRSAECCTIAETRANIVSASTIMPPAFSFFWLVTAHITNLRNNTLRYNMDAETFLTATIRHLWWCLLALDANALQFSTVVIVRIYKETYHACAAARTRRSLQSTVRNRNYSRDMTKCNRSSNHRHLQHRWPS